MRQPVSVEAYAAETLATLIINDRVNGVEYGSSQLTGPGITDTYDPEVFFKPFLAAGYWPMADDSGMYLMTAIGRSSQEDLSEAKTNEERAFSRKLILEATVEAPALERREEHMTEVEKDLARYPGALVVAGINNACAVRRAPLSVMLLGDVIESEAIAAGERVAYVYYPNGLDPTVALDKLRGAVRDMSAQDN